MRRNKIIALAVVGALIVGVGLGAQAARGSGTPTPGRIAPWSCVDCPASGGAWLWSRPGPGMEVTEDSPGWDCATMGNRRCS